MDPQHGSLPPDVPPRLAAIDLGTNSIRLIVAEPLRGGNYRILDEEKIPARLGATLSSTGRLDPDLMSKALVALRHLKQIAEGFQVKQLRAIATCAVREAGNGVDFCRRARDEVGLALEVISAEHEALLAFLSVQRSFALDDKPVAVVDIGGGSTEIVLAMGSMVEAIYPTQLGAVRLSELAAGSGTAGDGFKKLSRQIDRHLKQRLRRPVFVPHLLYGSGGTFTSLALMVMAAKGQVGAPVRGYLVTRAEVRHLLDRLRRLPVKERGSVPGLSPDRADIIVAGLAIVDRVMDRLEVNTLQVHNRGVRDGLLLTMIDELAGAAPDGPADRQAAVEQMAARCGVDLLHARHVARLAGRLFEQLSGRGLDPADRVLLEAAAWLQDVGYVIDYEEHHKHSYHLIANSRLNGLAPHDLELIANIARYHRGARPKLKHDNFRRLSESDRARVCRLAGILRIAGGLDRSNSQQVDDAQLIVAADRVTIRLTGPAPSDVDLWDAQRRTDLFEAAFDTRVALEWQPAGPSSPQPAARRRSRSR